MLNKEVCFKCCGEGILKCDNPDHSFIDNWGGEITRLGCPTCVVGVEDEICDLCGGKGIIE